MVDPRLLIQTSRLYETRARADDRYATGRDVLGNAVRTFAPPNGPPVSPGDCEAFVVLRTTGPAGESVLVRHPLDLIESAVSSGVKALELGGMLEAAHTCLIAVPRRSLNGTFTHLYEVVRRCDWSILPLGGSSDREDIAELCRAYDIDTVFIAAEQIEQVFVPTMGGRFDSVTVVIPVEGAPTPQAANVLAAKFPHIRLQPYLYMSNITGPLGLPRPGAADRVYDVLDHVIVEVESDAGGISLNGYGAILVSVLGVVEPALVRSRTGDRGTLQTRDDGSQVVHLDTDA